MPASADVCIVGAGLMGMALGRKLALDGHRVTVLESAPQVGGLATWHDFGDFQWDRFYHVVLPTDQHLIGLLEALGLEPALFWARTRTGFYVDERMHSISNNIEFLRFPPLSLLSKARLAFTLLYASRIDAWRPLEKQTVDEWLIRYSGKATFEKLWKPLLLAKLGPSYRRVSAVFIWSYIKRLFSARAGSAKAEHLGHVEGGYQRIFESLEQAIVAGGGSVETARAVARVAPVATDGERLPGEAAEAGMPAAQAATKVSVTLADGEERLFDRVICTGPASVLRQTVDTSLLRIDEPERETEYLGVVCVVIVSDQPISSYYVVNVADESMPFTGVIGMSTVVPTGQTGGHHLTYLPKYMLSSDAAFDDEDSEISESFLAALSRMFPDFDTRSITAVHVNRARRVQPLQVLDYSRTVPSVTSRHPGLFVLNTTQFVNATLNNNEVIRAVDEFHAEHGAKMSI